MPQDKPYELKLNGTTIEIEPRVLPDGFDELDAETQHEVAKEVFQKSLQEAQSLRDREQDYSAKDFIIPLSFVIAFALVILWVAKKIRSNPKVYDNVVKLDGKANPEYGEGWKDKKDKG